MPTGRTRAKVCGVTRDRDLRAAVDAGADAVGVISDVSVDTPRDVPVDQAAELLAAVPPFATGTLVTMPADVAAGAALVERLEPDAVQVHGLDPGAVADLRERVAPPVLAAVDGADAQRYAGGASDGHAASDGVPAADALVVDSLDPQGGGGTGETHDWERTRDLVQSLDVPVVLAGGLTPGNVERAVRTVQPFAVDVASGVEREGGVKDHDAVRTFVRRAARALDEPVEGVDA